MTFVKYINTKQIEYASKSIIIGDKRVYNPTEQMLREAGYKEFIDSEAPTPYYDFEYVDGEQITKVWTEWSYARKKEYYDEILVGEKIRRRYSSNAEFAILRQKDEKVDEFNEYTNYCELCKNEAKEELGLY